MVQVERAPFSRARWTHVVFTVEGMNSEEPGRTGSLYIDGRLQGSIEGWDRTLAWDPEDVLLVLGYGYAGHMDDLAVFSRALDRDEVRYLHQLEGGVKDLYR